MSLQYTFSVFQGMKKISYFFFKEFQFPANAIKNVITPLNLQITDITTTQ